MKMPEIGSLCEIISLDYLEHDESDKSLIGQVVVVSGYEKTAGIGLTDDDCLIVCRNHHGINRSFYKENLKVLFSGRETSPERDAFVDKLLGTDEEIIAKTLAMSDEEVNAELIAAGLDPNSGIERLNEILARTEGPLREKINGKTNS